MSEVARSPVSRVAARFRTGESARCRSSSVQSCQWPKAEASEESKRFIIVEIHLFVNTQLSTFHPSQLSY